MSLPNSIMRRAFLAAFAEARLGVKYRHGGPFGAVVLLDGVIIGAGHNTVLLDSDATRHAEMNAISAAGRYLREPHLTDCILVASSEPCPMCLAAAQWARVKAIWYVLPVAMAAKYGFDDGVFYEEFAKPTNERSIPVLAGGADLISSAENVFVYWQNEQGKIY